MENSCEFSFPLLFPIVNSWTPFSKNVDTFASNRLRLPVMERKTTLALLVEAAVAVVATVVAAAAAAACSAPARSVAAVSAAPVGGSW
jgi:hypothetical protein